MNHNSAISFNQEIFKEQKLSFAEIPHQTSFFIDYQNDAKNLSEFYPSKNKDLKIFANEVLANFKTNRGDLCDMLLSENKIYQASQKTFDNINKLRDEDCLVVITGQQAGLFSGSIYSIYKAISAIKLAEELSEKGIKAVPVFWIASEDHDFDEISKTVFIDKNEEVFESKNIPNKLAENLPIGLVEIEENIEKTLDELFENLPSTEFRQSVKDLLLESYKSGETFSASFGKLLAKLFKNFGLIFVSPLNEDLRKLCSPIYKNAIENSEEITNNLLKRDRELKEQGYHSQVLVERDFFPFFYFDKAHERKALRFEKDSALIKSIDGKNEFSKDELIEIANNSPHSLSPNALMRPIVQDYLFPTICYYGGGAEIAYFGQNSVIYDTLNRPITPIRHRASLTIIQGKHRRTLEKYDLKFKDLFDGKESISAQVIEKYLNTETAKILTETEEIINTQLNNLDKHLSKDDATLSDNLANRRQKILWHIATMRKKFHRSEILRNDVVNRRIEGLFNNLLPKDVLQERNLNVLHFINLYGENFIEWIYNAVDTKEIKHQVLKF